jgi:hypothetical protein
MLGDAGGAAGGGGSEAAAADVDLVSTGASAPLFAFALGLSHFSQRIPREIAAPHMKHFDAIGAPGLAMLRASDGRGNVIAYGPLSGRLTTA